MGVFPVPPISRLPTQTMGRGKDLASKTWMSKSQFRKPATHPHKKEKGKRSNRNTFAICKTSEPDVFDRNTNPCPPFIGPKSRTLGKLALYFPSSLAGNGGPGLQKGKAF